MSSPSYEIQVYRQGDWSIQAFFDDKELATLEARRMAETHRYTAVRVIEEIVDPASQETRTRVVFRDSAVDKHNQEIRQEREQVQEEALEARRRRQQERQKAAKQKTRKRPDWMAPNSVPMIMLKALGIAALGIGFILFLNMTRS
mgnify:CR=1 FL=1